MALIATVVAVLAVAGAFASWAAGASFYLRTLRSLPAYKRNSTDLALAIVAWPFVTGRLTGAAAEDAARVNKALVAFFVCLMIAVAATSLATNLSRLSR